MSADDKVSWRAWGQGRLPEEMVPELHLEDGRWKEEGVPAREQIMSKPCGMRELVMCQGTLGEMESDRSQIPQASKA